MTLTAGYDIGGAHLKVALLRDGALLHAEQITCPLWRGVAELDAALTQALTITHAAQQHAVTMTGELADVFPDRYTGVAMICERAAKALGPHTRIWMGQRGFGSPAQATANYADTASSNFLATATLVARLFRDGLLIDMGSTTTDLVALEAGLPQPRGLTDAERLRTGELVYTGLTRTPVMAITNRCRFKGIEQGLARDPFATMADVRRVLGELPEGVDQHATCDGRGKSVAESRARLARCFGRDAEPGEEESWLNAAREIADVQAQSILDGVAQVAPHPARIVTAGIGATVIAELATSSGLPHTTFGNLIQAPALWRDWATRCAPAVSVAMLAGS
jgi:(4-(4-[2-(gamma-L-glutamylamino)ethyl]phenoxymethyl)furan-2-yl)methanamine synthase